MPTIAGVNAGRRDDWPPAVCFARSTFFSQGLGFPDGGRQFVLQKVPFFSQGPASPMAAGSLFCKRYLFFRKGRLARWAAGGLFCKNTLFSQGPA